MTSKYSDEFKATVKVMWNDGKVAREIADATGMTTSIIASFIQYHRSEFPRHSPGKPKTADWHKPEIVATIRKLIAAGANYKMIKAAVLKQHGVSMSTGRLSGALGTLRLRLEPLAHIRAACGNQISYQISRIWLFCAGVINSSSITCLTLMA